MWAFSLHSMPMLQQTWNSGFTEKFDVHGNATKYIYLWTQSDWFNTSYIILVKTCNTDASAFEIIHEYANSNAESASNASYMRQTHRKPHKTAKNCRSKEYSIFRQCKNMTELQFFWRVSDSCVQIFWEHEFFGCIINVKYLQHYDESSYQLCLWLILTLSENKPILKVFGILIWTVTITHKLFPTLCVCIIILLYALCARRLGMG